MSEAEEYLKKKALPFGKSEPKGLTILIVHISDALEALSLARKEGVKLGASLTLEGLLTQDEKDKNKNWISVVKLAELNAIKNTKVRIAKEISDWIDGEIKAYEGFDRPKRFKEELKQILLGLKRFLSKPQSGEEVKKL